jgi:DNA ligase (NAD+)
MIFHTSKHAMDIEGHGRKHHRTVLQDLGWLHSIADIYRLDYGEIAQLEGFGEKSAANLQKAPWKRPNSNPSTGCCTA